MNTLPPLPHELGKGSKAKPTMEDVAEMARVCKATVSMVMNNDPRITQETRQRVLTVVDKLKYQVNETARALARRRKLKSINDPLVPNHRQELMGVGTLFPMELRRDA